MNVLSHLAVILLVAQTPVPTTGKAVNNRTHNQHSQNQKGNTGKNPRKAESAPDTGNQRPTLKPSENEDSNHYKQPAVNITNSASVPIPWGIKEWLTWGANLALVIVGIGGVCVAVSTLRKIERQTEASEMSAAVAKASMDAIINKERARLRVERPNDELPFLQPGYVREYPETISKIGETHPINLFIYNRGATTARDVKGSFCIDISPVTVGMTPGPREIRIVDIGDVPAGDMAFQQIVAFYGGIKQKDLEAIHNQEAVLTVSGEITYTDAFEAQKGRITAFSYEWKSDVQWYRNEGVRAVSNNVSGWYPYPPDANRTT